MYKTNKPEFCAINVGWRWPDGSANWCGAAAIKAPEPPEVKIKPGIDEAGKKLAGTKAPVAVSTVPDMAAAKATELSPVRAEEVAKNADGSKVRVPADELVIEDSDNDWDIGPTAEATKHCKDGFLSSTKLFAYSFPSVCSKWMGLVGWTCLRWRRKFDMQAKLTSHLGQE